MSAIFSWIAWCSTIGLPKVVALLGVGEGGIEGGPGHAHRPRGDVDATELQHAQDLGEAAPGLTDQVGSGDAVVGVRHVDGLHAPVAKLFDVPDDGDPLERRPGLLLDDEGGDTFVGPGGQRDDRRTLPVGDPRLGAVDEVFVTVPLGPAGDVAGVAARVGLGEGECAPSLPGGHRGQPTGLLLLGAVLEDQCGGHGVGVDHAGQAHPAVGQLLDDADVGQEVEAESPVGLGDGDAEEAEVRI